MHLSFMCCCVTLAALKRVFAAVEMGEGQQILVNSFSVSAVHKVVSTVTKIFKGECARS